MDLSRAFDCLPHDLIVDKLAAYGLCESACKLLASYLSNRKQRVKSGDNYSDWSEIIKVYRRARNKGPCFLTFS